MKLFLNKFIIIIILSLFNTSYANNFSVEYGVKTSGIEIGKFSWTLKVKNKKYETEINLKNSGFFSSFYKFEGKYVSVGVIENNKFKTQNYKQYWKTKKKTKVVEM